MEKALALKVYDVDYSFIIKNYLNEKLWEKEWTIFIYKYFVITLRLHSIDVRDRKIYFEIKVTDNSEQYVDDRGKYVTRMFSYNLSIKNINILKKTLNLTVFEAIQSLEEIYYIQKTDRYLELQEMKENEQSQLEEIASDFLDNENVTNSDIREAYIEYYIDKNEKVWEFINNYKSEMQYNLLSELYLVFLKATENTERFNLVKTYINKNTLNKVLKEIEEYQAYMETEEFRTDMESNLEEI